MDIKKEEMVEQPVSSMDSKDAPAGTDETTTATAAETRPERAATFKDYIRVFSYATRWDFVAYAVGFFASIGSGVTLPLMTAVFGRLSGNFTDYFVPGTTTTRKEFEDEVDKLALYIFALFIVRLVLSATTKFVFKMIGIRLSSGIRLHYLKSLFAQTIQVLDSMPPGYATGTITATANTLQLGISEKLATFIEYNATMVAALVVAFTWNWLLTLVTASVVLFMLLVISILMPFIIKGQARTTKAEGKANAVASEALAGIRMVAACGAETAVGKKFAVHVEEIKKHGQFIAPLLGVQLGLIFFGMFGSYGLSFWYGTKSFTEGRVDSVGEIIVVLLSVMILIVSLERTSTPLIAISKAMVAACEFFTVIDAPQAYKGHLKSPDVSSADDIVFENVTFAYPSRPHVKVLDSLNLRIEAGKINAIVGPSGSGKSTIVGLIQRWYSLHEQTHIAKTTEKQQKVEKGDDKDEADTQQPQPEENGPPIELQGQVSTSNHSLDDIDLKWWRSQIGLVQQEPFLFNDTIFKNVANGLVGSQWEDATEEVKRDLVREACKEAFADEFIHKLPEGYDTAVGDSGAKLSGGQRQRIAIARSIVRKPQILILDEATSAIDVRGERIVQAALDRAAQNRTTITIAHRLSTIKKADRIIVLKKGKVVESGTHETLITLEQGVYSGLVHAQALSLGEPSEAKYDSLESDDGSKALVRERSIATSAQENSSTPSELKEKTRSLFTSFYRLLYESKFVWVLFALAVLFAAGAGAAAPLQSWLFAQLVNVFQYANDFDKMRSESSFWSLMYMTIAIGVGVSYFGVVLFSIMLSTRIRAKYQQQYFEAVLFQKTSFFDQDDHSHGTMTARVGGDPKQLEELMGMNMSSAYIAIFNIIGTLAIAFAFGWKLALVACCVVMPVLIVAAFWRFKYDLEFEKMNSAVFAESSQFASEAIGAFRTVSSLTLEESICLRYEKLLKNHVVTAYKKARWVSLIFGFSDSVSMACQALVFYYGGRLLASREYDLISFFVCFMAVMNGGESAGSALGFAPNAAQATAAANRIINMRETKVRDDVTETQEMADAQGGVKIELQNLHFTYPTRNIPVFKGLSLTVEKGQFAALVGASGCGKTSIISLLERFYDLDGGRILCNGIDIHDMNIFAYRRHLSLVAQEPNLFQGTVRENILLGVDPSTISDDELYQVCRDASIHDFIISLPEGYNTNIGSRGVSLSGGQKQRVAIARALIRRPRVLLLDEATSSLDSESEKLVQAAFERAGKGRTMLVVAHRLATVQNADVIFVLGEGRLLEKGSHAELLKKQGVYWQMCQSQALDR